MVAQAMRQAKAASGSLILSAAALRREGGTWRSGHEFTLLPTPEAHPTERQTQADGMVVAAAVPILDRARPHGGLPLRRRPAEPPPRTCRCDQAGGLPWPETTRARTLGTVTIFQGDLRIATNVLGPDGKRAVGTRLSEAVYQEVLRARRRLGRPGVRGRRLVHYRLRADSRPPAADHRRAST